MKIAITGAMGVGKTTLANQIGNARSMKVLPEVARMMRELGYKLDEGATPELERKIANYQERLEVNNEDWVSDRCFVDLLAYVLVLFPEDEDLITYIYNELNQAKYDVIFYIPPEFPIEDDGTRSTDKDFQKRIDKEIRMILKTLDNSFIIKGSREERLKEVLKHL